MNVPRRKFVQILTAGTFAAVPAFGTVVKGATAVGEKNESYWRKVKDEFTVSPGKHMINAANLCPAPKVVQNRLAALTKALQEDVSFQNRNLFTSLRKESLSMLASFLNVSTAELGITRNTSEANCLIAQGIDLAPGDEVIIWEQNHHSNREVWYSRAKRDGFLVKKVSVPANPSTMDELVQPFIGAISEKTRLVSFSHISNLSGLALPAKEICAEASARGIMTLIDGAQSFGMLQLDLQDIGCTFYSASTHKWLMGPFENGVIFIRKDHFNKVWPNIIGGGWKEASNVDDNLCVLGQRNDPSTGAIPEILKFHNAIGKKEIEERVRTLNDLVKKLLNQHIPEAKILTPVNRAFSGGVTVFSLPGKDPQVFTDELYKKYNIAAAPAGGIRLSPGIYNTVEDIHYVVASIAKLAHSG